MDLPEVLSVIDVADSVGLLSVGFGATNFLLETDWYCSVQNQNVAVSFYSEAAAARDVALGIVVTSLVEIVPLVDLEAYFAAVVRARLKHY